jgi:hypothetical protein
MRTEDAPDRIGGLVDISGENAGEGRKPCGAGRLGIP